VWDTTTLEESLVLVVNDPENDIFRELAFSPDGQRLAVRGTMGGQDLVAIYDLAGQELMTCCEHWWQWLRGSIEYSPDGTQLLTSGKSVETGEGTVMVWDAATGARIGILEGHPFVAWDATFSPDGTLIASGSGPDVRVWDAATQVELVELNHGNAAVFDVEFSPDGSRLASVGDTEGLLRVWALDLDDLIQIAEDRLTRGFTAAECEIYNIEPCPALLE
jgi:WD40 repeat protein